MLLLLKSMIPKNFDNVDQYLKDNVIPIRCPKCNSNFINTAKINLVTKNINAANTNNYFYILINNINYI